MVPCDVLICVEGPIFKGKRDKLGDVWFLKVRCGVSQGKRQSSRCDSPDGYRAGHWEGKAWMCSTTLMLSVLHKRENRHKRRWAVLSWNKLRQITGNGSLQIATMTKNTSPEFSTDRFKNKLNLMRWHPQETEVWKETAEWPERWLWCCLGNEDKPSGTRSVRPS